MSLVESQMHIGPYRCFTAPSCTHDSVAMVRMVLQGPAGL